ncbi:hypothetical protein CSUB01_10132 [Colletotrichum sublineola]|uniref:Uncharacterized protein n=1 Tax=Colletotrichum sublineola TaxID=1173701 RepID=A0A066XFV5_COLSU|nr:hypothetical protein CSUB01_10132 [Colletotrichum sublineola]
MSHSLPPPKKRSHASAGAEPVSKWNVDVGDKRPLRTLLSNTLYMGGVVAQTGIRIRINTDTLPASTCTAATTTATTTATATAAPTNRISFALCRQTAPVISTASARPGQARPSSPGLRSADAAFTIRTTILTKPASQPAHVSQPPGLTLTLTHLARRAFASLSSPPPGPIDSLSFPPPLAYPPGPNQTLPCLIDYAYLAILDPAFPCLALHHLTSPHLTSLGLQRSGAWCLVFGVPQGSFLLACDEIQNQDGLPAPLSLAAVPRRLFFSSLLFHLHSLDLSSSYRLLLDTHRRLLNLLPLAQLDFTRLDSTQLASPRRVDPYIPLLDGIGLNDLLPPPPCDDPLWRTRPILQGLDGQAKRPGLESFLVSDHCRPVKATASARTPLRSRQLHPHLPLIGPVHKKAAIRLQPFWLPTTVTTNASWCTACLSDTAALADCTNKHARRKKQASNAVKLHAYKGIRSMKQDWLLGERKAVAIRHRQL